MIIGSPDPRVKPPFLPSGNNWIRVDSAEMTSDAWIRITRSLALKPPPPTAPATMIAGVTHPTIMATTCCRASGMASWNFGTPFSSKILPRFIVSSCFRSAASPLFLIVCPLVRRNHLFLRSFVLTAPNNRHCAYIIANYYQKNN